MNIYEHLVGKRIKLISMPNDPDPIPVGSEGVVEMIGSEFQGSTQIFVKWDNGRNLMLLSDVDQFIVVPNIEYGISEDEECKCQ